MPRWFGCLVASTLLAVCGCAPERSPRPVMQPTGSAPEAASGWTDKPGWTANTWMVAAAHPLATDAGAEMLAAGGSAVDAAIAVQMVLTLVEPQSSGIGGGAFLLHYDGTDVVALDGRETAPSAATEQLFVRDGTVLPLRAAIVGGRSVGAPGVVRMLGLAHRRHGVLPWPRLFAPAIRLAEQGFPIGARLARLLANERDLAADPEARTYFYEADGTAKREGTLLRNPSLAIVFRELAEHGADAFYTGRLAQDIAAKVQRHPVNPGVLTAADIAAYQPVERTPLCFEYRTSRICGFPPPGSGTLALGQIFSMLESRDLRGLRPRRGSDRRWTLEPQAVHLYAEAAKLAYADREAWVGDPAFFPVPVAGLMDPKYLSDRAGLIGPRAMGRAPFGTPPGQVSAVVPGFEFARPSTSHLSVVDAAGRAVAMTTTIEDGFGSRQMVRGFLLNNQLTDFSLSPTDASGRLVANRVQPGKRPRSSMTPLLVFDKTTGRLRMTLGSPGGSAIINYVGKVLLGTLDWGLNVQDAIDLPNLGNRNGPTELEAARIDAALGPALEALGHEVRYIEQTSGLQAIERTATGWFAGADPRREGTARGQ